MQRLTHRADFLAAATGARVHVSGFVLQMRERNDSRPPRVGFTVSKKVGNAVARNRVRRRLRALVGRTVPDGMCPGRDYVLIGRAAAITLPFAQLSEDFRGALRRLDGSPKTAPSR
jgi:ribonuclease P protein component